MKAVRGWLAFVVLLAGTAAQAGTITYFHNDLAGSALAATNEQGQVIWRESYRPYGERLVNSPAASGNSVWFTSRRQDAESGLVYMRARHYDPVAGRFVSVDPVGFDEGNVHSFNRYAYGNNNPYRYKDPDGRSPVLLLRLFGGGAIGGTAGAAADAMSQFAAFGSVDWGMAAQSNAAMEGAAAGALSFLPSGTPAGLGIKAVGDGAARAGATVFKTGHYAERLAKEGVDVARAEKAVAEGIGAMRPNMSVGAEVRGRFELDGVLLEYRAYPLPNGSVNVGTIFPVKP